MDMEKLLLRADEVREALGLSRSKIYEMMANGELPTVRFGRSTRVPMDALKRVIRDLTETRPSESNND